MKSRKEDYEIRKNSSVGSYLNFISFYIHSLFIMYLQLEAKMYLERIENIWQNFFIFFLFLMVKYLEIGGKSRIFYTSIWEWLK